VGDDEESETVWWKRRNRFATAVAVALIAGALVILGSIYQNPAIEATQGTQAASAPQQQAAKPYARSAQTASAPAAHEQSRQTARTEVAQRPATDAASDRREISQLLDRWVDASRHHDAYRQATYYAPRVEEYFGHRNLTATDVRRAREKIFANSDETREFSIDDVRVQLVDADRAAVSFLKIWNFPGRPFVASAREEMTVKRVDGQWKIAGEREVNQPAPRGDSATREAETARRTPFTGNQ
jgi:ketosteroid isomerase-like protein